VKKHNIHKLRRKFVIQKLKLNRLEIRDKKRRNKKIVFNLNKKNVRIVEKIIKILLFKERRT